MGYQSELQNNNTNLQSILDIVNELPDAAVEFVGSTSTTTGTSGLVPAPAAGDQNKFLKGDGTWGEAASSFVVHAEMPSPGTCTIDTTFSEIQTAIQAGKNVTSELFVDYGDLHRTLALKLFVPDEKVVFGDIGSDGDMCYLITVLADNTASFSSVNLISRSSTKTLSASSWAEQSDGTYAQSVSYSNVTATNNVSIDCALTGSDKDANTAILQGWGCVNDCKQSAGTLTFYCYGDIPTVNVPITVVVM